VSETATYAQAINRALHDEMAAHSEVILLGEDVGKPGGVFGLSRGLLNDFGVDRVLDTPIAETAILGSAVGAAIEGLRPVAEIMFGDFLFVALDQIVNQAANIRYVSNGRASAPLVVRTQQGVTPGSCAQHAQCIEAHLANVPGIKVGLPITPQDAYAMLRAAIQDPDPCVIIEARSALNQKGEVLFGGPIEPAAGATLLRQGADAAIITWGTSVHPALAAAERLGDLGHSVAVLNLRWLSPIDDAAIEQVVGDCGRVLIVHEASRTGGFGAEIAARISERYDRLLKTPVRRLAGLDVRMPASPLLQAEIIPGPDRIVASIVTLLVGQRAELGLVEA
jgi:2-oxoisovalerate dehydrogenase E1 component